MQKLSDSITSKIKKVEIKVSIIVKVFPILLAVLACNSSDKIYEQETGKIRNIILLIGDGMGSAAVQAAMIASEYPLNIERATVTGFQKTASADNIITDSGAAATAIATGVKTYNGSLGVDIYGKPLKSILEIAEELGYSTGLISTSAITHATPAAFISHRVSRFDYENIASDYLKTDIDLFIGGGFDHFAKRTDTHNLIDSLILRGYEVDTTMAEVTRSLSGKIAGLVAHVHNPYRMNGRGDMLPSATLKAIGILDKNEKGFFLMVEGSEIDWAAHENNSSALIDETLDFDKAVGIALDFAKIDRQTLVIITGDHETGGVSINGGDIASHSVSISFSTTGHTGVMIPVYAYGPGSEKFRGFYQNTEIFNKMVKAFGF
jgi:alkaline phosphatase